MPSTSHRRRVAHLTTVHRPFDPRIFHKQLASLQTAGFETHLVAPHRESETMECIHIHALPTPSSRLHRLALQPQLYRIARSLEANLYQIHDPELLPLGILLKRATGARLVYDMHENYRGKGPVLGRALRTLEQWSFPQLDHVLLAEKSYRSIVDNQPADHTYIANYFTPIGPQPTTESGNDAERPVPSRLLYTGTVSKNRGLQAMVKLAALIRRAGRLETVDLVGVCHHEPQRTWAEQQIQEEQLDGILHRTGWDTYVQPSDMPPHYHRADVGLALFTPHMNYRHSMPTKFYEYLHYGLPIICSDIPLWRQFIERHDCGAVVPPDTPKAVLSVLDDWRAHPDKYRQLVQNARAAASEYRWAPMGDRLVAVYRELLDGAHSN